MRCILRFNFWPQDLGYEMYMYLEGKFDMIVPI